MSRLPDFYGVLGLSPTSSENDIKDGYRRASRTSHPDVGGSHEAFLRVGLAKRILLSQIDRRGYDSTRALERRTSTATQADELGRALDDYHRVTHGWSAPLEIAGDVVAVVGAAQKRLTALRETGRSTSRGDGSSAKPGPTPGKGSNARHRPAQGAEGGEAEAQERKWVEYRIGAAAGVFVEWTRVSGELRSARPQSRRQLLHDGYYVYKVLRNLQSMYVRLTDASTEQVQVHFHISSLLVAVASELKVVSEELDLRYSFKSLTWLHSEVARAATVLAARRAEVGKPPWVVPKEPPSESPRGAHGDGAQGEPSSSRDGSHQHDPQDRQDSGAHSPEPAPVPSQSLPVAGESHWGAVFGAAAVLLAVVLGLMRCGRDEPAEPKPWEFEATIKASEVWCSSDEPMNDSLRRAGFGVACVLRDTKPDNGDQPYVELWADGCERKRLEGSDEAVAVVKRMTILPCDGMVDAVYWRICQTRGGPLPDDCTWGTERL